MKINSHINTICSGLLKNAINAFREHIWKPRCILNVDKEKRLGITKSSKRFRMPSHSRIQQSRVTPNISGQYQLLLERWKRNWILGHSKMLRFVKKGLNDFDYILTIYIYNLD